MTQVTVNTTEVVASVINNPVQIDIATSIGRQGPQGIQGIPGAVQTVNNIAPDALGNVQISVTPQLLGSVTAVSRKWIGTEVQVNLTDGTFTIPAHGMVDGDTAGFRSIYNSAEAKCPGGMVGYTTYYVQSATTDTFKLSLTSGGAVVIPTNNNNPQYWEIHHLTTGSLNIAGLPDVRKRFILAGDTTLARGWTFDANGVAIDVFSGWTTRRYMPMQTSPVSGTSWPHNVTANSAYGWRDMRIDGVIEKFDSYSGQIKADISGILIRNDSAPTNPSPLVPSTQIVRFAPGVGMTTLAPTSRVYCSHGSYGVAGRFFGGAKLEVWTA